jgi:hypothetical protein
VLATGGLVGGGVTFDPPSHAASPEGPDAVRPPLSLSVSIPGVQVAGVRGGVTGSLLGPVLDGAAWPTREEPGILERAGVVPDGAGLVRAGVWAAGDVVHDRVRTILEAVRAGLRAGRAAAGEARWPHRRRRASALP